MHLAMRQHVGAQRLPWLDSKPGPLPGISGFDGTIPMDTPPVATQSLRPPSGGTRAVLEASVAALQRGDAASLALVIETEGSTYVRAGAMALFGGRDGQVGWLSGGCLEPDIEQRADEAARDRRIEWLDIDTRDDEDLFAGSALGCRGRLRIALLPLQALDGWSEVVAAWRARAGTLQVAVETSGNISCALAGHQVQRWSLPAAATPTPWSDAEAWQVDIAAPPAVLVFGAGPETPTLLPLLRSLGWMTTLIERRPRWKPLAALADGALEQSPQAALLALQDQRFDAALVMHHNFELDREALAALAASDLGFIGLLGPPRRRDDLFRVLPADARAALLPRLHSPVGLDLGGHGPEAIALSIAAQLHAYRHSQ